MPFTRSTAPAGADASRPIDPISILRPREVSALIGVSRSTLWRLWQRGEFPRPRKITNRLIGWQAGEVLAWLESRARAGSATGNQERHSPNGRGR